MRRTHVIRIHLDVDGDARRVAVDADATLVDVLREQWESTGVRVGCRNGDCGSCTVRLDGGCVKSCLVLAGRADGGAVETLRGLGSADSPTAVQEAFMESYAFQCGFCLPGMVLAAEALLDRDPDPDEAAVRGAISGNLCRCTGYQNIVRGVRRAAELRRRATTPRPPAGTHP